ncbi:acetyl-CoA synthetase-like protein [Epithele typhae]|uniref:acetyl-CoA synthetase-like protein n=1 Tax=Epithele typhae TaxID=378194 RepID=UPI002008242C|nr:acetyl-CoA synthetase-like protein [Epithele typhae]KAH9911783.1 acetyl-CoA synthetase-like protein [Epithele typhae]
MSLAGALSFYNPAVRTAQGTKSTTFRAPDLDTTLTIPELFKHNAEHHPEHPVFEYVEENGALHTLRFPDVYRAARKAASFAVPYLQGLENSDFTGTPVAGILATSDSISGYTFLVGLMYLAVTPFPISTRNSPIAVAHLVAKTGVRRLFVSADPAMQRLAREANEFLARDGHAAVELLPALVPMGDVDEMRVCIVMHSSGSTAFPKPIKLLDRDFRKWGHYGEVDLCGIRTGGHANPMFRESEVSPLQLYTGLRDGFCVPAFVEAWARDPEKVESLKTLRTIIYCGAPMNKQTGDRLTADGVSLVSFYGVTEIGSLVRLIPNPDTMDKTEWEWFECSGHIDAWLVPQEGRPGIFEPIAFDTPSLHPHVFNTTYDGRPAYATSDLLQQHPTKPHLFRVFGRADDQLMLSTGEKTNPAPLEAILLQDPRVYACLMFGRGRFQNGILVQPKEEFDPRDEPRVERFRNEIWPSVEKMNAYAPAHSRIFKEMIIVNDPAKPLEYTAKGTPRRQVCLATYVDEIDALYDRVAESSQREMPPPRDWSEEATLEYTAGVVRSVMKHATFGDEDDIFLEGCDSLQATWIRNTILHALRSASTVDVHRVPSNLVYTHPTVASLASYLFALVSAANLSDDAVQLSNASQETEEAVARMRALLDKYSKGLQSSSVEKDAAPHINGNGHTTNGHTVPMETVVVTGTTGRLGSHLLARLLMRPDVARVFALNRSHGESDSNEKLMARSAGAFKVLGLDAALLRSGKVVLRIVNLTKEHFGLAPEEYEEMRMSATQIIHNGWTVNFNVSLSSFEPLIVGARRLIDLALGSTRPHKPHMLFVSSAGVLRNHSSAVPAAELIETPPELAVGAGYSESKWVAEQLLWRASQHTGLSTTSVRVGQVSGDQRAGGWSVTEWVPALVRISQKLGCMPSRDENLTWVPVDVAAAALLEMTRSRAPVLHLRSPRPVPWDIVFAPMAARLRVPLVPYAEWLARVEADAAAAARDGSGHDAAHSLLAFLGSARMGGAEGALDVSEAVGCSKALADVAPLSGEDAERYLGFWDKVGFVRLPE